MRLVNLPLVTNQMRKVQSHLQDAVYGASLNILCLEFATQQWDKRLMRGYKPLYPVPML